MRMRAAKKAARRNQNQEPEVIGKPELNKKSLEMIKDKIPADMSYADYLIAKGKEYELKKKEKYELKQKELQEDKDLKFVPTINSRGNTDSARKKNNKHEQLYQHGLLKRAQKEKDLDRDEIEFKKNPEAYTFIPEIHEINHQGSAKPIFSGQLAKIVNQRSPRAGELAEIPVNDEK